MIIFGLVFIKKITKLNFFKKNRNRFKPVWLGFFQFDSVFRFGSVFFLDFFVWVQFGSVFFCFRLIKPKPNRTGRFFQILIGLIWFFSRFGFFGYFFFQFFSFFAHLYFSVKNPFYFSAISYLFQLI